jgi:hypothetical protein
VQGGAACEAAFDLSATQASVDLRQQHLTFFVDTFGEPRRKNDDPPGWSTSDRPSTRS